MEKILQFEAVVYAAKFLMKLAAPTLRPGIAIARNAAGLTVRHSVPTRGSNRKTSNGSPGKHCSGHMHRVVVDIFSAVSADRMLPGPGKAKFARSPSARWKVTPKSILISTYLSGRKHPG